MAPNVSHTPTTVRNHGAYTHCDNILAGISNLGKPADRNNAVNKIVATHITIFCPLDMVPPCVNFLDESKSQRPSWLQDQRGMQFICAKAHTSFTKLEPFGAWLPTTLLVVQCFCKWHSACYFLETYGTGRCAGLDSDFCGGS